MLIEDRHRHQIERATRLMKEGDEARRPEILLSRHALQKIEERGLDAGWIARCVFEPDDTEPDRNDPGVRLAFKAIQEREWRVLKVAHRVEGDSIRVITAYFDRSRRR
ncbi:MAG TPA: DUF4258 domain-containing protein [Beijerinckiaceae bacterium]